MNRKHEKQKAQISKNTQGILCKKTNSHFIPSCTIIIIIITVIMFIIITIMNQHVKKFRVKLLYRKMLYESCGGRLGPRGLLRMTGGCSHPLPPATRPRPTITASGAGWANNF